MQESELIQYYRENPIYGYFINMVPASERFSENIVDLRNTSRTRYFLNQQYELTVEMQNEWFKEYWKRDNDLYWCILDKQNRFLGTYRIYNIDFINSVAEVGSDIIREGCALNGPYHVEKILLSHELIFKTFHIQKIIGYIRDDNKAVLAMAKKIGAIETSRQEKNGVLSIEMCNYKKNFTNQKLKRLIESWADMDNGRLV